MMNIADRYFIHPSVITSKYPIKFVFNLQFVTQTMYSISYIFCIQFNLQGMLDVFHKFKLSEITSKQQL